MRVQMTIIALISTLALLSPAGISGGNRIAERETDIVQIGSRRELFVDTFLIDRMKGVNLVLHEPHDEGSVLYFDKIWEGPFSGYSTVIDDGDMFRLYYRGLRAAGKDGSQTETTCYATSTDGIHWVKPALNLYQADEHPGNNLILAGDPPFSHNFSPFLDTNPNASPTEKFKALAGTRDSGLCAFVSPDGVHWSKIMEKPVFTEGIFDSQNVAFWSESEARYCCYFRTWTKEDYGGYRTISRTTSADFRQWTTPTPMTFGNTPMQHLYTNQTHPYFRAPHIYVSIAARFMPGRQVISESQARELNVNPKYYKDCSDAVFMTSRGGNRYDRTFMQCFICPGIGLENWVSRTNYPALNVVQTGKAEMSVYVNHDYAQPTAHLRRYSLRLDGFASVYAPFEGGTFTTRPLIFKGKYLRLNASTSAAGGIRIELQDEEGNPLEGFSLNESNEIIGNDVDLEVHWSENADLASLNGMPIRMHFVLKDAHLYAFQFTEY